MVAKHPDAHSRHAWYTRYGQTLDARTDFANPNKPAKPLTALEELVQTLLLSPEFAVLE